MSRLSKTLEAAQPRKTQNNPAYANRHQRSADARPIVSLFAAFLLIFPRALCISCINMVLKVLN
jgi:hypothetical protein